MEKAKAVIFKEFLLSFGSKDVKQFLERNTALDLDSAIKLAEKSIAYFEEIRKWFEVYLKTGGYPDAIFDYIVNKQVSDAI